MTNEAKAVAWRHRFDGGPQGPMWTEWYTSPNPERMPMRVATWKQHGYVYEAELLYPATEVERLEARIAQLCEVIGGKEVATEDECQIHRGACFELSDVLIASGHLKVDHDGGTDAAWRNIIEAVKRLTGAQP